jgi:uncharacterized protein
VSELRRYLAIASIISGILIILGVGIWLRADDQNKGLKINGSSFFVEKAQDDATRSRGLSGRDSIVADTAMLFVFDASGQQCFWMKDMKFSIDIVWLDTTSHVTSIERNVSPSTYPQNFCHDGRRVIEFKASTADRLNLKIGDRAYLY